MHNGSKSFLGLGFETGQEKQGLRKSPDLFRRALPALANLDLYFSDHGDRELAIENYSPKLYDQIDLERFPIEAYRNVYRQLIGIYPSSEFHLNWGGDHSVGLPTVAAFLNQFPSGKVVWIDAHADMNVPEASTSGNFHGMPLAALLNLRDFGTRCFPWMRDFLNPNNLLLLGTRDLDAFEQRTISALGIKCHSYHEITQMGLPSLARKIRDFVGTDPLHVSFDVDSVDPRIAPATGVPVKGGFQHEELLLIASALGQTRNLKSTDIVEINPFVGTVTAVDQTVQVSLDFLVQLLKPNNGRIHDGTDRQLERVNPPQNQPGAPFPGEAQPLS